MRGLKALVAGLGLLVVLGTALVIGVVIKRIYASPATPSMTAAPAGVVSALPAGSRIMGLAGAGGEFAVWVSGAGGDAVYVIDPATGAMHVAVSAAK